MLKWVDSAKEKDGDQEDSPEGTTQKGQQKSLKNKDIQQKSTHTKNRIQADLYSKEAMDLERLERRADTLGKFTQKPAAGFLPLLADLCLCFSAPVLPSDSEKVTWIPGLESQILSGLNSHCSPFFLESQWDIWEKLL